MSRKDEECIDSVIGQETQLAVLRTTERALYTVQSIRNVLHYDALQKEPESYRSARKLREMDGIHRPELDGSEWNTAEHARDYLYRTGLGSVNPYSYPCRHVRASDLWCRRQSDVRLDRIYIARQTTPMTFNWKTCPTSVPTDHWMVAVKYAPKDAPEIGNGRWTLPISALKDESLIQLIKDRGIHLQYDLEDIKERQVDRDLSNPQRLWQHFKRDISTIAKARIKATHYKINTHIRLLEKDIKTLENDENVDTDDKIRSEGAFLTTELEYLEKRSAQNRRQNLSAELANHGEIPGGIWTAISKERKPRDLIRRLMVPESNPPQYERNSQRMAGLAKNYHEKLQHDNLEDNDEREFKEKIETVLNKIHREQILTEPEKALHLSKNGSATGMDGCPYELWKLLEEHHNQVTQENKSSFDITKALMEVFTDIQRHGVNGDTDFALGWMCPIYKKKDRTEISNYRPITLLNTDYKILTKTLALQLMEHIPTMVHKDQAGFIPKRSIFNHIRLAKAIITYADITEKDGAIGISKM